MIRWVQLIECLHSQMRAAHHIHSSPEVNQLSGFKRKITLTVDHYIKAACFPCSPDSPAVSWTGFIHWFCWNHFLWLVFLHRVLHSPQRDPSPRGPSSVPNPLRLQVRRQPPLFSGKLSAGPGDWVKLRFTSCCSSNQRTEYPVCLSTCLSVCIIKTCTLTLGVHWFYHPYEDWAEDFPAARGPRFARCCLKVSANQIESC